MNETSFCFPQKDKTNIISKHLNAFIYLCFMSIMKKNQCYVKIKLKALSLNAKREDNCWWIAKKYPSFWLWSIDRPLSLCHSSNRKIDDCFLYSCKKSWNIFIAQSHYDNLKLTDNLFVC